MSKLRIALLTALAVATILLLKYYFVNSGSEISFAEDGYAVFSSEGIEGENFTISFDVKTSKRGGQIVLMMGDPKPNATRSVLFQITIDFNGRIIVKKRWNPKEVKIESPISVNDDAYHSVSFEIHDGAGILTVDGKETTGPLSVEPTMLITNVYVGGGPPLRSDYFLSGSIRNLTFGSISKRPDSFVKI